MKAVRSRDLAPCSGLEPEWVTRHSPSGKFVIGPEVDVLVALADERGGDREADDRDGDGRRR